MPQSKQFCKVRFKVWSNWWGSYMLTSLWQACVKKASRKSHSLHLFLATVSFVTSASYFLEGARSWKISSSGEILISFLLRISYFSQPDLGSKHLKLQFLESILMSVSFIGTLIISSSDWQVAVLRISVICLPWNQLSHRESEWPWRKLTSYFQFCPIPPTSPLLILKVAFIAFIN